MNKSKGILIVDDEVQNQELLKAMVESFGHETKVARNGHDALGKLSPEIDLVLLDVMMSRLDGFEVVKRIRENPDYSDLPIIMVTALTGKEDCLRSVELGANDFISKPVDKTELQVRMTSLLKMKEAQDAVKRYQAELERRIKQRNAEVHKALQEARVANRRIYKAYLEAINSLALAAEYKDEETGTHIKRLSRYCVLLARAFNLSKREVGIISVASPMHDVGKVGIPDAILLKHDKLSEEEREIMKQHTIIGARILGTSDSELLQAGKIIALSHHERWDTTGYPNGLAGEDIPLWGRICAVADVFDALTSKRPYKEAFPNSKALEILKEERARHLDPELVDLFIKNFDEVVSIQETYRDK